MTIRLDELSGWTLMGAGNSLALPCEHEENRRVRLNVNCEEPTWLYVDHGGSFVPQFVAALPAGCETLEFVARGDLVVSFVTDDAASQVWVQTSELEPNVVPNPNAVSFTEIVARRARNPELEMMQALARQNERRMRDMLEAQSRGIAELKALYSATKKGDGDGTAAKAPDARATAGKDADKDGGKKGQGGGKQPPVAAPARPVDGDDNGAA